MHSRNFTKMEEKQRLATAALVCAVVCSEKPNKKKRKHHRMWAGPWLYGRGQQGLSVLQRELEVSYDNTANNTIAIKNNLFIA